MKRYITLSCFGIIGCLIGSFTLVNVVTYVPQVCAGYRSCGPYPSGPTGATGQTGPTGSTGEQGPSGSTGSTGPEIPPVEDKPQEAGPSAQVGSPPAGEGKHNEAVCTGVLPDKPILQGFKVINDTTDEYSWWAPVGGVDKYAVVYGYSPDALVYGIDNIDRNATSIQIGNLRPKTQSWLQVWAFKNNCVSKSEIFN